MRRREITGALSALALWGCALPAAERERSAAVGEPAPAPPPPHPGGAAALDAPDPCTAPAVLDEHGQLISVPAQCHGQEPERGDPAAAAGSRSWQPATPGAAPRFSD